MAAWRGVAGDDAVTLYIYLRDSDRSAADLSAATSVVAHISSGGTLVASPACQVIDADGGVVALSYVWPTPGEFDVEFAVETPAGRRTFPSGSPARFTVRAPLA